MNTLFIIENLSSSGYLGITIQQTSILNADYVITLQINLEAGFPVFKF
jgi:hypothetical protein